MEQITKILKKIWIELVKRNDIEAEKKEELEKIRLCLYEIATHFKPDNHSCQSFYTTNDLNLWLDKTQKDYGFRQELKEKRYQQMLEEDE